MTKEQATKEWKGIRTSLKDSYLRKLTNLVDNYDGSTEWDEVYDNFIIDFGLSNKLPLNIASWYQEYLIGERTYFAIEKEDMKKLKTYQDEADDEWGKYLFDLIRTSSFVKMGDVYD
jgi:hypothetical protein